MKILDLFSGIGGFTLGFEWASSEFKTVAFCEIDKYAQKVLKKHWPEVPIYDDITRIGAEDIIKLHLNKVCSALCIPPLVRVRGG